MINKLILLNKIYIIIRNSRFGFIIFISINKSMLEIVIVETTFLMLFILYLVIEYSAKSVSFFVKVNLIFIIKR